MFTIFTKEKWRLISKRTGLTVVIDSTLFAYETPGIWIVDATPPNSIELDGLIYYYKTTTVKGELKVDNRLLSNSPTVFGLYFVRCYSTIYRDVIRAKQLQQLDNQQHQ